MDQEHLETQRHLKQSWSTRDAKADGQQVLQRQDHLLCKGRGEVREGFLKAVTFELDLAGDKV